MLNLRATLISVAAALTLTLAGCAHHEDADTSTTRTSQTGLYQVSYTPDAQPIPMRQLHSWTLEVRTRDGQPVTAASIQVDGGMPDHGHGLPTKPLMRKELGEGRYVIDGMKFNMGGYWVVDFAIDAAPGKDTVRFELNL